jgi:large subunit ribosomal protein L21
VHAIVEFQGRQYRVESGEKLQVPRLQAEPGSTITIDRVLLIEKDGEVRVGSPVLEGARVDALVVSHGRGPKIIVGKYKKRKDYRRRNGYRDDFTAVEIGAIHLA